MVDIERKFIMAESLTLSAYYTKENLEQAVSWLNARFEEGYTVDTATSLRDGVLFVLKESEDCREQAKFFRFGQESEMSEWVRDFYNFDYSEGTEGYLVRAWTFDDEDNFESLDFPFLVTEMMESLWWLWLIGAVVFGILWWLK